MPRPMVPAPMIATVLISIRSPWNEFARDLLRREMGSGARRKQSRRVVVQDLALRGGGNRQRAEFFHIAANSGNAGAGPVGAPQNFIGNLFDARKMLHQPMRRDTGNINIHIRMTTNEKKCFLHPQRTAAMSQNDNEFWKIDGDIIREHGLGVDVS